jgi:hypothetical protein
VSATLEESPPTSTEVVDLAEGQESAVWLTASDAAPLRIRILDGSGDPVPHDRARCELRRPDGSRHFVPDVDPGGWRILAEPEWSGRIRIVSMGSGPLPGSKQLREWEEVIDRESRVQEVRLPGPADISGTLRLGSRAEVITVSALTDGKVLRSTRPRGTSFKIPGLPEGSFDVRVEGLTRFDVPVWTVLRPGIARGTHDLRIDLAD